MLTTSADGQPSLLFLATDHRQAVVNVLHDGAGEVGDLAQERWPRKRLATPEGAIARVVVVEPAETALPCLVGLANLTAVAGAGSHEATP